MGLEGGVGRIREPSEGEEVNPEIMESILRNLETYVTNAKVLQDVLAEEHSVRRNVTVESISSSLDLGGFFVDQTNSSSGFRAYRHVGKRSGDAITGNVLGLVGRKIDNKPTLQLALDVGYEEGTVICYFNLDDTLEGCYIDRVGLGAES